MMGICAVHQHIYTVLNFTPETLLADLKEAWIYDGANVSVYVAFQIRAHFGFHGTSVMTSGGRPSTLVTTPGHPVLKKAAAINVKLMIYLILL